MDYLCQYEVKNNKMKFANRIFFNLTMMALFSVGAYAQSQKSPLRLSQKSIDEATAIVNTLPLRSRITQLIMPVVKTFDMDSARILIDKYIGEYQVGGIMFYKGDCEEQIELYNRAVSKTNYPFFVAIDGEWGLNMRLRKTPRFPVNMALGAVQDLGLIEEYGKEVGRQCRRMGISVNFAPCLDVNSNPDNPVIGRRSFGDEKDLVAQRGVRYAVGLESAGVLSCAKHFPGHGDTNQDSHKTLPTVNRTKADIYNIDLYPFRKYIETGLNGMMVAHLNVPAIDSVTNLSSSISPVIVNDLLRKELNFKGLVFTDALNMKGVTKYDGVAVKALLAGNDILVMPDDFDRCVEEITQAVENGVISEELLNQHCIKILAYKIAMNLNKDYIDEKNILQDLDTEYCRKLRMKLAQKSITLVRKSSKGPIKTDPTKSTLVSLGDDENLKMMSLGDTIITTREFYRYIDENYAQQVVVNSKTQNMPSIDKKGTVVVEVFSAKQKYIDALEKIAKLKDVTIVFYVNPYEMLLFKNAVSPQNTIVCAYEDTYEAQIATQKAIQGIEPFEGVMPVKIDF